MPDANDLTVGIMGLVAQAKRILWTDVSHISDNEMRDLMRDIANRLYTFDLYADEPELLAEIERWMAVAGKWDEPEIDPRMVRCHAQQH